MSAILAVFQRDGKPIDPSITQSMLQSSNHRAKDGCHVWQDGPVSIAHQHLWVTPEEQGEEQPLTLANEQYVLAFDGRLDNRADLIAGLGINHGKSAISDAQLTLQAYVHWGEDCVRHLLGIFAFVVWDKQEGKLFWARDALGMRQLCYHVSSELCIVASIAAPILSHPSVQKRLNQGVIAEYIIDYDLNQTETFFESVYFCPPAYAISVTAANVQKKRYWFPDLEKRVSHRDERTYAEEFLALLTDSVRCCLRSEGPFAIALSGGMDSTSVAALAASELDDQRLFGAKILKTYSLTFEDYPRVDEKKYIRAVSQHYDLDSTYLPGDYGLLFADSVFPGPLVGYPFSAPTNATNDFVHQKARDDGCRVLLGGFFSDMLFMHHRIWAVELLRQRDWATLSSIWGEVTRTDRRRSARSLLRYSLNQLLERSIAREWLNNHRKRRLHDSWLNRGISADFVANVELAARVRLDESHDGMSVDAHGRGKYALHMHWGYVPKSMAIMIDDAQAIGLDVWDPFADIRLIEYVLSVPAHILGRPGIAGNKRLLRQAMAGRLPEVVRKRPRENAYTDWAIDWFQGVEWQTMKQLLVEDPLTVEAGYYSQEWISQRLLHPLTSGFDRALWQCLSLELWLRNYASAAE